MAKNVRRKAKAPKTKFREAERPASGTKPPKGRAARRRRKTADE